MKRKRINLVLISGLCMQIASLMLTGCSWREKKAEDFVSETSIFSWEEEYILPEMEDDVEKAMEKLNCKAVYQQISQEAEETQVLDYLKRRKEKGQRVYYLAGASDWGVEENGASMLEAVRITAEWNKIAERKVGLPALFLMWSRIFWKNGMTIRRAVWNSMQPTVFRHISQREKKSWLLLFVSLIFMIGSGYPHYLKK